MDIKINQGDKFIMELEFKKPDESPVDISGKDFLFCGKYNPMLDNTLAFIGETRVVEPNRLRCIISAENTGKLKNAKMYGEDYVLYWDIFCTSNDTRVISGTAVVSTGISYRKRSQE